MPYHKLMAIDTHEAQLGCFLFFFFLIISTDVTNLGPQATVMIAASLYIDLAMLLRISTFPAEMWENKNCDTHICPSGAYVEPVIENS